MSKTFYKTEPETLGGSIVFSYIVNAVRLNQNPLANYLHQQLLNFYFRWELNKIIAQIIVECNAQHHTHFSSYTIRKQNGVYVSPSGRQYVEPSVSLELLGSSQEDLITLGQEILTRFRQKSVMVVNKADNTKFHIRSSESLLFTSPLNIIEHQGNNELR